MEHVELSGIHSDWYSENCRLLQQQQHQVRSCKQNRCRPPRRSRPDYEQRRLPRNQHTKGKEKLRRRPQDNPQGLFEV